MYIIVSVLLMLLFSVRKAIACTTVILGKKASTTGHVVVGHNEDDAGHIINRHGFVPPAHHFPDELLPAEPGCASIPQVASTHGFYWSEIKRASGGLSNADSFYNDAGVLIVSDSCGKSNMDMDVPSLLSDGGIGYNLRRIMAERAGSAREAIEIAASLLDKYGYTGSGRAYIVADAEEAWVLQASRGKNYVARRVGDDEIAFIPNWFTVHEIDEDSCIASPNLLEYAIQKGWYSKENGAFDFARAWQSETTWMNAGSRFRCAGGYSLLTRTPFSREEHYPFAIVPREPISIEHVKEVLRSHYEGTVMDPTWMRIEATGGSPHDTELRRICTETTVESLVAVFDTRDRPDLTTIWTSFGRPCELPYLPLHPYHGVPTQFDSMGEKAQEFLSTHCLPDERLSCRQDGVWQEFRDYQSLFELFYEEQHPTHERALWSFEQVLANHNRSVIDDAANHKEDAAKILRKADEQTATQAISRLRGWTEELKKLETPISAQKTDLELILHLSLDHDRVPQEELFCLFWESANARKEGIRALPGSLQEDNGDWIVRFSLSDVRKAGSNGTYDFYLGGRDQNGRCFGGHLPLAL